MPKRLLLVDDDSRNLVLLERHLLPLGHEIARAHDGPSALAHFEQTSPDLVLLDMVLPGMDGLQVLARMHALGPENYVPVILVTAHSEREHRRAGLDAGADDLLEKPVEGSILRARVTVLLQLKESRDALRRLNAELAARDAAIERLQREHQAFVYFCKRVVERLGGEIEVREVELPPKPGS
jgi:DNA-binding response OmpR family regulator